MNITDIFPIILPQFDYTQNFRQFSFSTRSINMKFVLLLLAVTISCVSSDTKFWSPKGQSLDEWYTHPIKCPKTALKFPELSLEFLEGHSHEREIIFAMNGIYLFQNDAQLLIGDSPAITSKECANAFGEEVIVHSVKPQLWTSPSNWQSASNGNPAKPDIEKIPCDADEVIFNSTVTRVDLDGLFQLQMKGVTLMDKRMTPRDLGSFCKTVVGQKMFDNCDAIEFSQTVGDPAIRACQSNAKFYQSLVCESVPCPLPSCINPIRPLGFCCDICGATAQVEIHADSSRKLDDLNLILMRKLKAMGFDDKVAYWASYFNYKTKFLLQVNIVDRDEYREVSPVAMGKLANEVLRKKFGKKREAFVDGPLIIQNNIPEHVSIYRSGMPYDPTARVNTFTLVVMPLLVVCAVFIAAYKMSYDENLALNWRSWMQRFSGRSQFIFAQFENVLEDHEGRITISHTPPATTANVIPVIETGVECQDEDVGMEMVAGGPEEKVVMGKDKLDEVVETISANDSHNLISMDM